MQVLKEAIAGAQAAVLEGPVRARRGDGGLAGVCQQGTRDLGPAVDELGAELERDFKPWLSTRPDATTDAVTGLQYQHRAAGVCQFGSGDESGGPGTDHQDVVMRVHRGSSFGASRASGKYALCREKFRARPLACGALTAGVASIGALSYTGFRAA